MKKLIYRALSIFTAFVMIFLSIAPTLTTAYAAQVPSDTPDTPDTTISSLKEQTITATIYSDSSYKKRIKDNTEITLAGKMPEGAVAKAYPVDYDLAQTENSDEAKKADTTELTGKVILSYDVTIFNGKNSKKEFEPDGDSISVTFKSPKIGKLTESEISVIHVTDDGKEEEIVEKSADNGELTITATEFSVYVIIEHEGHTAIVTPRVKFHFISDIFTEDENNAGHYTAPPYTFLNKAIPNERQTSQILTDGETLEMIANPPNKEYYDAEHNKIEKYFYGWYVVNLDPNGTDTTAYNGTEWTGIIPYTWPADPDKVSFEKPMTLSQTTGLQSGNTITWTIDGVTYPGTLNEEGIIDVYLAPIYEDYFFVNFRLGAYNDSSPLKESLMTRRLVVFGSAVEDTVRIGDVICPSSDPTHLVFTGWQTKDMLEATPPQYYSSVDVNTGFEVNSPGHTDGYYITINKSEFHGSIYDLYPLFTEARWLSFNTGKSGNGATYVGSTYRLTNDEGNGTYYDNTFFNTNKSTRQGYNLEGWYAFASRDGDGNITNLTTPQDVAVNYMDDEGTVHSVTFNMKALEIVDFANGNHSLTTLAVRSDVTGKNEKGDTCELSMSGGAVYLKVGSAAAQKLFEISDEKLYFYKRMDDLTLYANWTPVQANYTVVYWLQNANDDDYSMLYYDNTKSGTAGTMTTAQEKNDARPEFHVDGDPTKEFKPEYTVLKYCHLSDDQDKSEAGNQSGIQQQKIAGDNSTIVNVYYDRYKYRLRFDMGFSRVTNSNSGTTTDYLPVEPADVLPTDTIFGIVNGVRVPLTRDGSSYTYSGTREVRNAYNGEYRYKTTTDSDTPPLQYGLYNGSVVPLTKEYVSYTRHENYYYQSTNTNTNNSNLYGIVNGSFQRIYKTTNTGSRWRIANNSTADEYTGTRYQQGTNNNTAGNAYTDTPYYIDGTTFTTNDTGSDAYGRVYQNNSYQYFLLDKNVNWDYNGTPYTETRYLQKANNDNDNPDLDYNQGFIDSTSTMQTIKHDDQGWYYTTTEPDTLTYNGQLYKQVTSNGTTTYYISTVTNSYNDNNNNYRTFLTTSTTYAKTIGDSIPTDFIPYARYTKTVSGTQYTVYYYDLIAKYGETILDKYPGTQPTRVNGANTYPFVGWIAQPDSYSWASALSSVKGFYDTMSEDLILTGYKVPYTDEVSFQGNYPQYNSSHNVDAEFLVKENYTAIVYNPDNDTGITHEFHCRYQSGYNKNYLYRIYLADPNSEGDPKEYPSEPTRKFLVYGGSGSNPIDQTTPTFYGYSVDSALVLNSSGVGSAPTSTYSSYEVAELKEVGISSGCIMEYKYQPNPRTITFAYGAYSGHVNDLMSSEIATCYGRSLKNADKQGNVDYTQLALDNTPAGYEFTGWYTNADAIGTPFDFSDDEATMPDANLIFYACYSPLRYLVKIDPNGAEIDHVNHEYDNNSGDPSKRGYSDYWWTDSTKTQEVKYYAGIENTGAIPFKTFNRDAIPGDGRAPDSGYDRSASTYVNARYNALISEYTLERKYVPISDTAVADYLAGNNPEHPENDKKIYYYVNTQWSENDGSGLPSDCRNALYMTEDEIHDYYEFYADWMRGNIVGNYITGATIYDEDTWKQLYVSKQKYRTLNNTEHYKFIGWYQVFNEGTDQETLGNMPYVFSTPVTGPVTLRAVWRLDGGYKIQYHGDYTMADGTWINGEMQQGWWDPEVGGQRLSYADDAHTTVFRQPTGITANGVPTNEYIFRGFRIVSVATINQRNHYTALEPGVYYDPGEPFEIKAEFADSNSYIHLQAVYEEKDSSYRRPEVTNLILDANSGSLIDGKGYINGEWYPGTALTQNTDLTQEVGWDTIGKVLADVSTQQIKFSNIQSNQELNLYRFATVLETVGGNTGSPALSPPGKNYFTHAQKFFLLGFDENRNEGDYLATYPADSIISIDRKQQQTIYAVWEPMIYLNFENNTEGTISFGLSAVNEAVTLYILNEVTGLYDREKIVDPSNISLAPGATMHLALPLAEEKEVRITGTNNLGVGKLLTWNTRIKDDEDGTVYSSANGVSSYVHSYTDPQTHITNDHCSHPLAAGQKFNQESFEFTEKLLFNSTGLTVTFDDRDINYALVLEDNYPGGGYQEYDYSTTEIEDQSNSQCLPYTTTRMGYQLAGWAYTPDATTPDYSSSNNWTISSLYHFFKDPLAQEITHINSGQTTQAKLYAVWTINNESHKVYVYKNVPEPGNRNTEFKFTVALEGTYKPPQQQLQPEHIQASKDFYLKHGEYAVLVNSSDTTEGYLRCVITIYNADNTVNKPAVTFSAQAPNHGSGGSFQTTERFTVTEEAVDHYTTSVKRTAQTQGYHIYLGDPEDSNGWSNDTTTNDPLSTNRVQCRSAEVGGTVIFTNQRATHNITVEKILHSNINVSSSFALSASYEIDDRTVDLPNDQVTTGTPNTTWLRNIPEGAKLTLTEGNDGTYITKYKIDNGSLVNTTDVEDEDTHEQIGSSTAAIEIDSDKTITLDNTKKSFPVKFRLFDQNQTPLGGMFRVSLGCASLGGQLYADPEHGSVFYSTNNLYVGNYTLTQDIIPSGYVGLSEPATISVTGSDTNPITTNSDMIYISQDPDVQGGYIVTVYNIVPSVDITLTKVLDDPLINQRTFDFTVSYVFVLYDGENNPILTIHPTNNYSIQATSVGTDQVISVPGSSTVTITENLTAEMQNIYSTTHSFNSGTAVEGTTWTQTIGNSNCNVTFTNTRKTVNVTVKKIVEGSGSSFGFNAFLKNGNNNLNRAWTVKNGYTTDTSTGRVVGSDSTAPSFSLGNNGTFEMNIPYGTTLSIEEPDPGNYAVSVSTLSGTADLDTDHDNIYKCVVKGDDTITFTNTEQQSIAPTAVAQVAGTAFAELLSISFIGAGIYFVQKKRRKEAGYYAI